MPKRLSFTAIRCASARSGGNPALRKDPHRPLRICCLISSESGACMEVDCDICPSFSSSVMRASSASIRFSISGAGIAYTADDHGKENNESLQDHQVLPLS